MRKNAYTLAEVLITIGVIGVLAAIMLPLINKYKPDKNKVLFLRTYDDISTTIANLAHNGDIYPVTDGTHSYSKAPLANTASVTYLGKTIPGGDSKLCAAMALYMNYTKYSCDNEDPTQRGFVLENGVNVKVNGLKIAVDINGDKSPNCLYGDNCKKPDQFTLQVTPNGYVVITDSAGEFYKRTRSNLKMKDIIQYPLEDVAKWEKEEKIVDIPEYKDPEKPKIEDNPPTAGDQESSGGEESSSSGGGGYKGGGSGDKGTPNSGYRQCNYENQSAEDLQSEGCMGHNY